MIAPRQMTVVLVLVALLPLIVGVCLSIDVLAITALGIVMSNGTSYSL